MREASEVVDPPPTAEPRWTTSDLSRSRAEMAELMDTVEVDLAEAEAVLESIVPPERGASGPRS